MNCQLVSPPVYNLFGWHSINLEKGNVWPSRCCWIVAPIIPYIWKASESRQHISLLHKTRPSISAHVHILAPCAAKRRQGSPNSGAIQLLTFPRQHMGWAGKGWVGGWTGGGGMIAFFQGTSSCMSALVHEAILGPLAALPNSNHVVCILPRVSHASRGNLFSKIVRSTELFHTSMLFFSHGLHAMPQQIVM